MLIRTHLTAITINNKPKKPIKVIQSVLLRRRNTIRYCWLDCPRHLDHNAYVTLNSDNSVFWRVLEIFAIKFLFNAQEIQQAFNANKIIQVVKGGSYELTRLSTNKSTS